MGPDDFFRSYSHPTQSSNALEVQLFCYVLFSGWWEFSQSFQGGSQYVLQVTHPKVQHLFSFERDDFQKIVQLNIGIH